MTRAISLALCGTAISLVASGLMLLVMFLWISVVPAEARVWIRSGETGCRYVATSDAVGQWLCQVGEKR